ncbi:MAG TPA: DUF2285 domain-containing protein [Burkholderiaceae bacterium]|nr:DUF2285 domain-containing protein [Burkholderiaceae bacterium]
MLATVRTGSHRDATSTAAAGVCDSVDHPELDARRAHIEWLSSTDDLLQVRASRSPTIGPQQTRFDLWRVPGRKRLSLHSSADLALAVDVAARRLRIVLADDLADGAAYARWVPLRPGPNHRIDDFDAQARILEGEIPRRAAARPVTRMTLLHLRALQALDGDAAGASQRELARVLFGPEAVATRWQPDSELRAQVRHLLRRARAFVDGGYLTLAGAWREPDRGQQGDEAAP